LGYQECIKIRPARRVFIAWVNGYLAEISQIA
jgi:hypothetical protein